jgi:3-oxoacyl-[acyl-carrier-protein] synthase II
MAVNWTERRVVITGLGVVSALGNDPDTFWNALVAGRCGVERITAFDPSGFDTQIAAQVKDFDPAPAFPSPKEVRRTDRFSQFGVFAGWQALRDSSAPASAGWKPSPSSTRFCSIAALDGSRLS